MNRFTILCTEEQTKKALELGAPISEAMSRYNSRLVCERIAQGKETREEYNKRGIAILGKRTYDIPTAEEMNGWLEETFSEIDISREGEGWCYDIFFNHKRVRGHDNFDYRREATLAAIDAALDYLKSKN